MEQNMTKQEWMTKQITDGGIPIRHAQRNWRTSTCAEWNQSMKYLSEHTATRAGGIYAIIGRGGTGKTQMAVCLAKWIASQYFASERRDDWEMQYMTAVDIYAGMMDCAEGALTQYIQAMIEFDLLIIDDIQTPYPGEYDQQLLRGIIAKRYQNPATWTILVGNIDQDSFENVIGESISRSITETGCGVSLETMIVA